MPPISGFACTLNQLKDQNILPLSLNMSLMGKDITTVNLCSVVQRMTEDEGVGFDIRRDTTVLSHSQEMITQYIWGK